jgi:hypothetical protein
MPAIKAAARGRGVKRADITLLREICAALPSPSTSPEAMLVSFLANPPDRSCGVSKSDEEQLAKLVKKNAAKAAQAKKTVQRRYDTTLPPETTDDDIERRDFFSEMKKREF